MQQLQACFRRFKNRLSSRGDRRGSVIVMSAAVLIMILAFVAFSVDVGYLAVAKGQLQNAADAAALAGAMELNSTGTQSQVIGKVRQAAADVAAQNRVGELASLKIDPAKDVLLGLQTYDPVSKSYSTVWGDNLPNHNIVKVFARRNGDQALPLFFAPVIGHKKGDLEASALATFQPRDIMVVLDYSGSMNDDSELKAISKLGRTAVENNIYQMWEDLGKPTYGNLKNFEPKTLTQIATDAGLLSGLTKKKLNDLLKILADPSLSDITNLLGLTGVKFPYPGDSNWSGYINYVQSSSQVKNAGYQDKYGMLTFINYLNEVRESYAETPDLWKVRQQPITALKDGVDLFIDFLEEHEVNDRVGLSVYTYPDSTGAKLESPLTLERTTIKTLSRQRQAGHYEPYTNIGAGMRVARLELTNNTRYQTLKMMVLMTDGLANRSSTKASPNQFVIDEAKLAAEANIKIMTISLGTGADTSIMQQVADMTKGQHFNVPGGSSIAVLEAQLKQAFEEIAADRPLKLIGNQ